MSVLSVPEAKVHLNIKSGDHDAELETVVSAAQQAIEGEVGPLESTVKTDRARGGATSLILRTAPAISLTSVTPIGGSPLLTADLDLDAWAALVHRVDGMSFPDRAYTVVYTAGRAECPEDLLMALKELVRHMWTTQRGGSQRPGSQPSETLSNSLPGSAHTFPFRVEQLLKNHKTNPAGA